MYNEHNIFFKILRAEIPFKKVYEDEFVLAIWDINPLCNVHVLVITKSLHTNYNDFITNASKDEVFGFFNGVSKTADCLNIAKNGYRLVSNTGRDAGQEVPHFHMHILGGESLGPVLKKN